MKFIFIMNSKHFNTVLLPLALVVMFSCQQESRTDESDREDKVVVKPSIWDCWLENMEDKLSIWPCEKPDFSTYMPLNGNPALPVGSFPVGKYSDSAPLDDLCLLINWFSYHPNSNSISEELLKQKIIEIQENYTRFPVVSSDRIPKKSHFLIYYGSHSIQELRVYFVPRGSNEKIDVSESITLYAGHPYLGAIVSENKDAPMCIPWPDGMSLSSYISYHPLVTSQLFCVLDPSKTTISGWGHFCVIFTFTDGSVKESEDQCLDFKVLR